jgi:excisionase family DNA binding protein
MTELVDTSTQLLTVADVAAKLQCTRLTIYRRIYSGELAAVRIGDTGRLRVRPEAVEALLRPAREHDSTA